MRSKLPILPMLFTYAAVAFVGALSAQTPEFTSLESAKPVLQRMGSANGAHPGPGISSKDWLAWLQKSDGEVRQRLDTGEEDSLTNLLRFGVTFTREYRIDDEYLVK